MKIRTFRWSTVELIQFADDNFISISDDLGNDELVPREDDFEAIDDDIDAAAEIQMRKIRYEQQKFLEEKEV